MVDVFLLPDEIAKARAGAGLEPDASALLGPGDLLPLVGRIIGSSRSREPWTPSARRSSRTPVGTALGGAPRLVEDRRAVAAGVLAHARRLRWSADRIAAERQRALRELVTHAAAHSPFHAARLGDPDPTELTESGLAALPVMTKRLMMEAFDDVVTDSRLSRKTVDRHLAEVDAGGNHLLLDRYRVITSSGSSGLRGSFVYDRDAWTTLALMASRSRMAMLDGSPRPPGSATANCFGSGATTLSSAMSRFLASPDDPSVHLPMSTPVPELVARLNALQPTLLQAYPTALDLLVHETEAGRLRIAPRFVETGGELLTERTRTDVAATWGAGIDDCWGLSEGIYAFSCPAGPGMHLPDDLIIVEPVDRDGRPVPSGEPADKLYVTNLYNRTQPLIRFEVADALTVHDGRCGCGSAHRRIDRLVGRNDIVFAYGNDVRVYPMVLGLTIEQVRGVIEYQIRQTGVGVSVRARGAPSLGTADIAEPVREVLRAAGLAEPEVTVELVDRVDRLPSGKLRQFVALGQR